MLWKSGNFKQQNFTWKLKVSVWNWNGLKRNLQSKKWEIEKMIIFEILETQCHLLKLRKKWSKSNELCLQKDKKWYWPSFYFETETKTFNIVKILTETSNLIAQWKILFILSSNANDTKVAINWKKCVYVQCSWKGSGRTAAFRKRKPAHKIIQNFIDSTRIWQCNAPFLFQNTSMNKCNPKCGIKHWRQKVWK